jgi:hypothetical protein
MRGVRPAMDLDDDRTGLRRVPSLDQPGVVGMSFGMYQLVTNGIATVWLKPVRAVAREPTHGAILDGVDLSGPAPVAGDYGGPISGNSNRVTYDLAGDER